jgi:predicted  nucleic acid-binding Zn-ribbon protein
MLRRLRDQVKKLRTINERLDRQHQRIADLERELIRVSPQLAALEERVEALRQRVDQPDYRTSPEDQAEAVSLVEEVRREHAQVRARISAATVFEERLRVVEEQLRG